MAAKRGANGRRLELGLQLRQLRESTLVPDTGKPMTRKQAVVGVKLSEAALARVETGQLNFRNVGDLRKLLTKYNVSDEDLITSLVELNRDAANQTWVTRYRAQMPSGMPAFVGIEGEAREIRVYHPTSVHGLLQTEPYARALFETGKPVEETTTEFIRQGVEVRMLRKQILERDPDPVWLWAILTEAALRYVVGDADVMCEQYEEIAKLALLPHIKIQVLPLAGRGGYRASHDFAILDLGDGLPPTVQIDTAWGAIATSDKPREFDRFKRRFETMIASALPAEDTPEFMHRLVREMKSH
ncbi:helix-turn-helix domain-containing protein [Streptomyces sp. NPDC006703]|uniref:helix-turn-helix domain-containing protein n=1 Tax=Streptomyces sp. NPDC006703 TaxID=3364759 RepID=UPI003696B0AD